MLGSHIQRCSTIEKVPIEVMSLLLVTCFWQKMCWKWQLFQMQCEYLGDKRIECKGNTPILGRLQLFQMQSNVRLGQNVEIVETNQADETTSNQMGMLYPNSNYFKQSSSILLLLYLAWANPKYLKWFKHCLKQMKQVLCETSIVWNKYSLAQKAFS